MPAAFNDKNMAVVDERARVRALGCKMSERACRIQTSKPLGAVLDAGALRDHAGRKPLENLQLQSERALGGARNFCLQLAQLGRGKAYLAGQSLAVDEGSIERRSHQPL